MTTVHRLPCCGIAADLVPLFGHTPRCPDRCAECCVHLPSHGRHATGCSQYRWPQDGERRSSQRDFSRWSQEDRRKGTR